MSELWAITPGGAGHVVRESPRYPGLLSTDCGIALRDITPERTVRPCKRCQLAGSPLGDYQLYRPSASASDPVVDLDSVLP